MVHRQTDQELVRRTNLEKKESGTQVSVCLEVLNLWTNSSSVFCGFSGEPPPPGLTAARGAAGQNLSGPEDHHLRPLQS